MDFKKILQEVNKNIKNKKGISNLIIVVLAGVLILIAANTLNSVNSNKAAQDAKNSTTETAVSTTQSYETDLQNQLKNTLEQMDGVGNVDVMINFESGEEKVPALNSTSTTSTTQEKDTSGGVRNTTQENTGNTVVVTNSGSDTQPLILKTYKPKVTGICIIAQGAEDSDVRLRITEAVVDLFNIPENKVDVYPMKN
jgi:stage III sporulation protein AG